MYVTNMLALENKLCFNKNVYTHIHRERLPMTNCLRQLTVAFRFTRE